MFGTLLASPFNTLFGQFYDMTGSYHLTIMVSAGLVFLALLLAGAGKTQVRSQPLQVR